MPDLAPNVNLPLIYISYSRRDESWLDKILTWLKPLEESKQVLVFCDQRLIPGENWDEGLRENLEKAALGIVLLSPEWLANDYAINVEFPVLASRRLIPVLVRECDWHGHPIGKFQILMADNKPLSSVRGARQEQAFRTLVQAVRKQLDISSGIEFSREGQELYTLASQLAQSRKEPGDIDAACLLFALLERGREEPTPIKTPQFLWNAIPESGRSRYQDLRQKQFPQFPIVNAPFTSSVGGPVLERAHSLSLNTKELGRIHARHLLAALLVDPDGTAILSGLDLDLESSKSSFILFVLQNFPDEPEDQWRKFLAVGATGRGDDPNPEDQPDQQGSGGATPGPASPLIAAYQSEDWTGPDLLNTTRDVNALAALVAGWNVQPPLSIGLFGEWGSGKSFFMRQMRERVKALALAAQKSGKPQRECAYYKNIAQIEFNAWHYMEGDNLWACLVEHIFSNLGLPQDTAPEEVEARQKEILLQIGAKKTLEAQAIQSRTELEAKRDDAVKKANEARSKRDAAETALAAEKAALKKKVANELSSEVTNVLAAIPEAVQLRDEVETARRLSQDVRTLWGRIALLWNLLWHDPQRRKILYWMCGGSAALLALGQVIHWLIPDFKLLVRYDAQAILPVATALLATVGKFRPVLAKIGHVVSVLEKKNQEITAAISKVEQEGQPQIAKLEGNVAALTQQIERATREQQQHTEAIQKLEKELAETDANRLLDEFIRNRADADDYRKHLGMVALVRRDFEKLSEFFRSQRKDELQGKERLNTCTVNRIVLYIDDLDRCPPRTVVDTLQAIHLLLAFPIFVVVVAVDSRWVSRSLEECYDWLVPETEVGAQTPPAANGDERWRSTTGATAHDYLEKIFQIPFWLAPMNSAACRNMIRGLAKAISSAQSTLKQSIAAANPPAAESLPLAAVASASSGVSTATSISPSVGGVQPTPPPPSPGLPIATPAPAAAASTPSHAIDEPIDLTPRQLDVEENEMKKIDELAVLIGRSPRVAKRFLNCYRLLKARMDNAELEECLKGPFQYLMEVLAIIVGAPSISRVIVEVLCTDGAAGDGKAFLRALAKRLPAGALDKGDGLEVNRLLSGAPADHMKSLSAIAPLVARFSFATHSDKLVEPSRGPQRIK
jgi:hypothetical protein